MVQCDSHDYHYVLEVGLGKYHQLNPKSISMDIWAYFERLTSPPYGGRRCRNR
jgi:hypothetical protein